MGNNQSSNTSVAEKVTTPVSNQTQVGTGHSFFGNLGMTDSAGSITFFGHGFQLGRQVGAAQAMQTLPVQNTVPQTIPVHNTSQPQSLMNNIGDFLNNFTGANNTTSQATQRPHRSTQVPQKPIKYDAPASRASIDDLFNGMTSNVAPNTVVTEHKVQGKLIQEEKPKRDTYAAKRDTYAAKYRTQGKYAKKQTYSDSDSDC